MKSLVKMWGIEDTYHTYLSVSDDSRKLPVAVERLKEGVSNYVLALVPELPAFSGLASLFFQNQGLQIF